MRILIRIKNFVKDGDLINKLFIKFKRWKRETNILSKGNSEQIFKEIYKTNFWKGDGTRSGPGSSIESTVKIREEIPKIIKKYKIKNILDVPCGDFYWFAKIINELEIEYLGGDIVSEIIESNNLKYKKKNIKFIKIDITCNEIPEADLLICRDLIFHLSYSDIDKLFYNLKKSNIKYILVSWHDLEKHNLDNENIKTGSFRFLDLFKNPFSFEKNFEEKINDPEYPESNIYKVMYLFKLENFIKNISRYHSKL
tara:strand:- start:1555 stop:2316 length:762 start_codon:yes stop_codon:yes gene_type:complete